MGAIDIPMNKAELLSVLLEAILYGFSLLMFGGTIYALVLRRSSKQVNYRMTVAACMLLTLSTAHFVIHIIRVMEGLILNGYSYSGGSDSFFEDTAQWTFYWKNGLYITQSLLGDAVIIYRCYCVWQFKLIVIFPLLLWCATAITGYRAVHLEQELSQSGVFSGALGKWITAFWAMALSTNLLATFLLAWRIWSVSRETRDLRINRDSHLQPVLRTIIDSGLLYSLTLLVALICFVSGSNAQYVTLDMVMPIISIAFYIVIVRVGFIGRGHPRKPRINPGRRNTMQVHVTTMTESKSDRPWCGSSDELDVQNESQKQMERCQV